MDAKDIVSKMDLHEKISMLCGSGPFTVSGVERLNVPPLKMSDGPNGVKEYGASNVCFPSASVLGCSWDESLVEEVGKAIGLEAKKYGVDILLGPGLNLKRSPLCGRNFEYYSEDGVLSGILAAAYIRGVQSCGVCACMKHFAVNSQEKRRMRMTAEIDMQTLRETYLKGFELAVRYGRPKAVMSAYNKINGVYCSQNKMLLTDILRGEWGFDGAVISDWCAVEDIVAALNAGMDIDMPGNAGISEAKIERAVREGRLAEDTVAMAAERVVRLACRDMSTDKDGNVDSEEICLRAARESMVLLKNDDKLPLEVGKKVLVIGKFAKLPRYQGGGSANVGGSSVSVSPLTALKNLYATEYIENYPDRTHRAAYLRAKNAEAVIIFAGLDEASESEGYDRKTIDLPREQTECIRAFKEKGILPVVVLQCGSAVETDSWKDCASAILLCGYAGQRCGEAVAQLLCGEYSPCGKLAETYPVRLEDTPAYLSFAGNTDKVYYGERMFIGYKYYGARKIKTSYPFGYGLTYSRFEYSGLRAVKKDGGVHLKFNICNAGDRAAKEIIQIYVGRVGSLPHCPEFELKTFRKIYLAAGESADIKVFLNRENFQAFDMERNRFICFTGLYRIDIAASSEDVRLSAYISIKGDTMPPRLANADTLVGEIWNRENIRQMVMDFLLPYIKIWFTGSEEGEISLDDPFVRNMVENMPLRAFAYFSEGKFDDCRMQELIETINEIGITGGTI